MDKAIDPMQWSKLFEEANGAREAWQAFCRRTQHDRPANEAENAEYNFTLAHYNDACQALTEYILDAGYVVLFFSPVKSYEEKP